MNFQSTLDLNNEDLYAHFYLGNILKEMGDSQAASEQFQKVLEISPDYSWAYYNLAVIDFENGFYEEAVYKLEQSLKYNPKDLEAYINYIKIMAKQGLYDSAKEIAERAIAEFSDAGDIYYLEAQIDKKLGNLDDCRKELNLAMQYSDKLSVPQKRILDELEEISD